MLLRRPDVSRAERQLAAATANIGVAKSDLFPKFFLTGSPDWKAPARTIGSPAGSRFWSVGPTVQWRIFDAGRIRANIKVQNARQEQALAAYEQTVLMAFEEVEDNLVLYAKEQMRRRSLEDAVTREPKIAGHSEPALRQRPDGFHPCAGRRTLALSSARRARAK